MAAPENALQTALYAAIAAEVSPVDVVSHPSPDKALPYVQLGVSDTEQRVDGWQVTMQVHVWSNKEGPHEVQDLQQQVRDVVHRQTFTQSGWRLYCVQEVFATVIIDEDEETWHGVQQIQGFAQPE